MSSETGNERHYWRRNLRIVFALLGIWFFVSYGCGILWVESLNTIHWGGFPLGFWFSQQGAIIVFIFLILAYCLLMDRLEAHMDQVSGDEPPRQDEGGAS